MRLLSERPVSLFLSVVLVTIILVPVVLSILGGAKSDDFKANSETS